MDNEIAIGGNQAAPSAEYLELARIVRRQGLLEKQPGYYALNVAITLGFLAFGFIFLALVDNLWLVLLDAVLLSVVFARLAFLGHDAGHRQIFRSNRGNDIAGLGISFLLGMERTWWVDKHNRHHSNPNQTGMDPDIDIPVLAFSEEDALKKRRPLPSDSPAPTPVLFPIAGLGGRIWVAYCWHPIPDAQQGQIPGRRTAAFRRAFRGLSGAAFLAAGPLAGVVIHTGAPTTVRPPHGPGLCP